MRARQHKSARYESANHESDKYGKPNIHNITLNLILKTILVQLIKSSTAFIVTTTTTISNNNNNNNIIIIIIIIIIYNYYNYW